MADQPPIKNKGGYRQINDALNICAFEDYLDVQLSRLPKIADIEQISPRVIRVLGQNAGKFTLQGTNTYIVGTGPRRLLIDTGQGIPEWADLISSYLLNSGIVLSQVFLTHWHGDHTGGVPDLLRLYPDLAGFIYKNSPNKTQQAITDGQVFQVEGATIRALHSPGHSHDHMCFVLEEEQAMFTGDNILGHGTAAVEKLSIWMESLRVMQTQKCTMGYPAHGEVIQNLPAKVESELVSRTRREAQIQKALTKAREGAKQIKGKASLTVRDLVTAIHGENISDEVREQALDPLMEEVLRKLAEDGKVAFEIKRGQRRWFGI
ncbi:putative Metallo-beta-lactamase domain-containing protein [Seiridium unicorne]|uniref:Metallo-beta-lactamase domain-containing protein n=1 Tax=Seiridium unicorne TaxID=138068 RepID=A0ABR2UTP3_9PEZI